MKYVVYLEDWAGCFAEEVFSSREDAERYINGRKEYFIIETNGDYELEMVY